MTDVLVKEVDTKSLPAESTVEPMKTPVPAWAIHRRLYDWVLSLAHHKHSTTALFAIAFAESSFFPVPPDVLQIALTLERRNRAWYYAFVALAGSIFGAVFGYLIGWLAWEGTKDFFFSYVFSQGDFERVQGLYAKYDFWVIFMAAFTPIPYKVITIGAGVCHERIALWMLIVTSIIGRGGRFFLVGGLLWWLGPSVKNFIDRYFNWLCLVFTILLIGGFLLIKMAAGH